MGKFLKAGNSKIQNKSYVDGNNVIQTVNYVSDALGFRVTATNLPQGAACLQVLIIFLSAGHFYW